MRLLELKSVCRRIHRKYIRTTPEVTAENILNRKFYADKPNEKWLTDVTEFKYNDSAEIKKLYLSATLDLYDRRIVWVLLFSFLGVCALASMGITA